MCEELLVSMRCFWLSKLSVCLPKCVSSVLSFLLCHYVVLCCSSGQTKHFKQEDCTWFISPWFVCESLMKLKWMMEFKWLLSSAVHFICLCVFPGSWSPGDALGNGKDHLSAVSHCCLPEGEFKCLCHFRLCRTHHLIWLRTIQCHIFICVLLSLRPFLWRWQS